MFGRRALALPELAPAHGVDVGLLPHQEAKGPKPRCRVLSWPCGISEGGSRATSSGPPCLCPARCMQTMAAAWPEPAPERRLRRLALGCMGAGGRASVLAQAWTLLFYLPFQPERGGLLWQCPHAVPPSPSTASIPSRDPALVGGLLVRCPQTKTGVVGGAVRALRGLLCCGCLSSSEHQGT